MKSFIIIPLTEDNYSALGSGDYIHLEKSGVRGPNVLLTKGVLFVKALDSMFVTGDEAWLRGQGSLTEGD